MKWNGTPPVKCELCDAKFKGVFYDANVPNLSWGKVCVKCFFLRRCKTGTGRGQRYDLIDEEWTKTQG